jgi:hypothetical protein
MVSNRNENVATHVVSGFLSRTMQPGRHHRKLDVAECRPKYRQGRRERAVKVRYTHGPTIIKSARKPNFMKILEI